ncbi:hypothetical protein, partial [Sphingomonas sp. GM_Shp_2]|uniref:hypothetical protein n=1 Tax=Sphingomonas sp. GM_Shp_2 TaxID=2937380 RepID=UPI00226A4C23
MLPLIHQEHGHSRIIQHGIEPSIGLGECAVHATSSRNFRFQLGCPLVAQCDRATQVQLRHHLSRKYLQCQLLTLGNALR